MKNKFKKSIIVVSRVSQGGAHIFSMKFLTFLINYSCNRYNVIYIGPLLDENLKARVAHIQTLNTKFSFINEILFFFYFPIVFLSNFGFNKHLIISHCRIFPLPVFRVWSVYHSLHFQQLIFRLKNPLFKILYFFYHFFYSILDIVSFIFSEKNFFINPDNLKINIIPRRSLMPNFVDTDLFCSYNYPHSKSFRILFIGRNDIAKGIGNTLISIYNKKSFIQDAIGKDIFLTVVSNNFSGNGSLLNHHINFCNNEQMVDHINNSDLFINPSLHENVSTVLLESMSCQKIVLTRNTGYIPAHIPYPNYQVYVHDSELVNKIIEISKLTKEMTTQIGLRNREFVMTYFGLDSIEKFFIKHEYQI